jgi:hypothetical protein
VLARYISLKMEMEVIFLCFTTLIVMFLSFKFNLFLMIMFLSFKLDLFFIVPPRHRQPLIFSFVAHRYAELGAFLHLECYFMFDLCAIEC